MVSKGNSIKYNLYEISDFWHHIAGDINHAWYTLLVPLQTKPPTPP